MNGTLAVVTCFAANFAPRGWAYCNGQILAISTNQALFSLLGTTFGGNGQTTFALPDLRNRVPIGTGTGPGLGNYTLGQAAGSSTVTLTINNLPAHNHTGNVNVSIQCDAAAGTEANPDGMYPAGTAQAYGTTATPGIAMAAPAYTVAIQPAGGSQPMPTMPPYLGMNYIICLQGVFPSRN